MIHDYLEIEKNADMKKLTTIGIGGKADYLITVRDRLGLSKAYEISDGKMPVTIIGQGSKILVSDKGIRGLAVRLKGLNDITVDDGHVSVGAGASLITLSKIVGDLGYGGLEWASGIPASIGGAVLMNAGAFGGSMSDVIKSVEAFDGKEYKNFSKEDCRFGYRDSIFKTNKNLVITSAKLFLKPSPLEDIRRITTAVKNARLHSQPIGVKSAGSAFKRPNGISAGELIEKAGLKGYKIGGIEVSKVHANFIINTGGATCQDASKMLDYIQAEVWQKFNVKLEREIILIGEN